MLKLTIYYYVVVTINYDIGNITKHNIPFLHTCFMSRNQISSADTLSTKYRSSRNDMKSKYPNVQSIKTCPQSIDKSHHPDRTKTIACNHKPANYK